MPRAGSRLIALSLALLLQASWLILTGAVEHLRQQLQPLREMVWIFLPPPTEKPAPLPDASRPAQSDRRRAPIVAPTTSTDGSLSDFGDPRTWPVYQTGQLPPEDFYKIEQAYTQWHKDHPGKAANATAAPPP